MKRLVITIILFVAFSASAYADENNLYAQLSEYNKLKMDYNYKELEKRRDLLSTARDISSNAREGKEIKREYLSLIN